MVRHPVQEVQPKYVRIGDFVSGFIVARSARGFGGTPTSIFAVQKRASVYTLALLDTNVHPTNLRKCKKSNYLPILDVFKDFAAIVVDDSPNHNRNLRKILIFSHVRLNNYNIPFYYNMWRTMQRRSEVSCRTKY